MTELKKSIRVACVQLEWGRELDYNLERTLHYIKQAEEDGSRVVCFQEANLTGYYFPYILRYKTSEVESALKRVQQAAKKSKIWAIVGTIKKTSDRYLNLAHVISPSGNIVHEYAKVHLAGEDEKKYCRGGNKISYFDIDGIKCTIVICRDGRHPELYRIPAMAGAKILFQPSCSSDSVEDVAWKRIAGRAQLQAGPTTRIFHCVANAIGQSPDGIQTSSGTSFIRDPSGLPLAEASPYKEEMISAVLNLDKANRSYAIDSLNEPPFLRQYWEKMIEEMLKRADNKPE